MSGRPGPVVEVDTVALWRSINYRLFKTSKTAKEVADLLGFTPQVFSDIKAAATGTGGRRGHSRTYQPGSPIFLTICWWLAADPRTFQRIIRVPDGLAPASGPPAVDEDADPNPWPPLGEDRGGPT